MTLARAAESSRSAGVTTQDSRFKDTLWVVGLTLVVRALVIGWGASRFPPAADGQFYQVVANRIGLGLGYTWLWPDGVVTYAAHYPVGYPAILGGLYSIFGPKPIVAMFLNGFAGAVTTLAVHRMALRGGHRGAAFGAGVIAALHPTFVFYTPAMMTELLSAALLIGAASLSWVTTRSRWKAVGILALIGLITGLSTLVRPQQILWAPLLGGWLIFQSRLSSTGRGRRILTVGGGALLSTLIAVGCCLPWTLRNCEKMERCVFVSANGGWNLFIGASPLGRGAWTSIDSIGVPSECRLVFKEAEKDHCFGEAAKRTITAHPLAWAKLIPAKLGKTFDDVGAPGYYLNAANSSAFGERGKWWLGASEVLIQRLLVISAAVALAFVRGPRTLWRRGLSATAIALSFVPFAWLAVLACVVGALMLGRRLLDEPAFLFLATGWAMTAAVHAVFFGGARYAIVVMPFVIVAAARLGAQPWAETGNRSRAAAGPVVASGST